MCVCTVLRGSRLCQSPSPRPEAWDGAGRKGLNHFSDEALTTSSWLASYSWDLMSRSERLEKPAACFAPVHARLIISMHAHITNISQHKHQSDISLSGCVRLVTSSIPADDNKSYTPQTCFASLQRGWFSENSPILSGDHVDETGACFLPFRAAIRRMYRRNSVYLTVESHHYTMTCRGRKYQYPRLAGSETPKYVSRPELTLVWFRVEEAEKETVKSRSGTVCTVHNRSGTAAVVEWYCRLLP